MIVQYTCGFSHGVTLFCFRLKIDDRLLVNDCIMNHYEEYECKIISEVT